MLTDLYGPEFVRPMIEADLFRGIQMGEACFHSVTKLPALIQVSAAYVESY